MKPETAHHEIAAMEAIITTLKGIPMTDESHGQKAVDQSPTYGQKAVGFNFNPSGDPGVDMCKTAYAGLIDQMDRLRAASTDGEVKRMASYAITCAQTAQMWAVKALTWKG